MINWTPQFKRVVVHLGKFTRAAHSVYFLLKIIMLAPPSLPPFSEPVHTPGSPWWVFLWAIVGFIVYGSLFPFDFQETSLSIDHFLSEWHIFRGSPDELDNFLLFVPLGIALHACYSSRPARLIAAFLAVLVLALGIQFVQLYLPSRTASLSDAFWNTVGLCGGFMIATRFQKALEIRLSLTESAHDYFAMQLTLLWFCYESFPFVPTLDVGLLRDHVKSVIFAPPFEVMRLLQHGLAATLGSIAILRANWLQPRMLNLVMLGGLSLLLEVFVAYGSLRRETLLGITLGLLAGYFLESRFRENTRQAVLVLALCTYLLTVLTPYRAQSIDAGFTFTPFSHIFWHGITKDIPPTAFEALAIGSLLWAGLTSPRRFRQHPYAWIGCVLVLLVVLECVRIFVVGFHGDTTPLVVAAILSPFAVSSRARSSSRNAASAPASNADLNLTRQPAYLIEPPSNARRAGHVQPPARKATMVWICATGIALTLGLWLLLQLPGIPYNLKKLFGNNVVWGAGIFSLALIWLGSGPWLVAQLAMRTTTRRGHITVWLPFFLLGIALVSFLLVNLATPEIMLDKIIGSPDLYRQIVGESQWGEAWRRSLSAWPQSLINVLERTVRYGALYLLFMIPLTLCALAVHKPNRLPRVLASLLFLLPFWWVAKCVVLDWAVTDNLTELIKPGGVFFLAVLIVTLTLHATLLASYSRRPFALLMLTIAVLPATWWLLNHGVESLVISNGRVFSGVQFLLGENRTALLPDFALFSRWCLLYSSGTAITALGMGFAMRLWPINSVPMLGRG